MDRLVEIAKIQSTEASNKIEGIVTTSTRMKQLFEAKTTPRNRDEDEIMGYRDVLNTIHESNEYIPIRSAYILQLHRDLLKRAGFSYGGHFKNVQNYINETKPDGTVVTRFTPIAPYDTPEAVENLCNAYEQAIANEKIDSLILIPTFICDFLCIHPFNDGNGRMSRLLTLLLLYKNGYSVGKYISIEKQGVIWLSTHSFSIYICHIYYLWLFFVLGKLGIRVNYIFEFVILIIASVGQTMILENLKGRKKYGFN